MANGADGSIVIDTELDNEGFNRGSDRMLSSINRLVDRVDSIGNTMQTSFSAIVPLLQNIANTTQQMFGVMTGNATQTRQANDALVESEQQVTQAAQGASQAVTQQGQAVTSFTGNVNTATQTVSSLEREINSLSSGMASISQSAELGFGNSTAVLSFDAKLTAMAEKIEAAKQKLAEFGAQRIPTEDYAWLQQAIQQTETNLNRLIDKQLELESHGVSQRSSQWQRISTDIEQARTMLAAYRGEMADLEASGGAFTLGSDSQQYAQMQTSLQNAETALQRNRSLIDSEAIAQARLNVLTAQEAVYAAQTDSARAAALERLREAQAQLQEVAAAQTTGGGGGNEQAISGWQRLGAAIRNVGSTAKSVIATLGRMGFNAIAAGAKRAANSLKLFARQSNRTNLSSRGLVRTLTSLKTMLVGRIKYMFISGIVNSVSAAMKSLALFSDSFNRSMSNIKNSTKEMGGNIAVSVGNLVNAIAPALTTIINMISKAMTYLNAFIAMLSGKKTMTVAKKQTGSYADSLKDAAGAAKELNRQVYGFDELNKRNKESSGGGGGAGDGSDMFEEVPVDDVLPEGLKDWFERLKAAIEAGDWYGVGQILAEGLNTILGIADDWINNTLRPKGVEWAGNIAQILNGLVDGFDWTLLGKTVADGLNAVADIVNTFLTTFNFENFGMGIGKAINGLFDNVEWDLLGQTFANGWNALINTIYGIVSTVDWSNIGSSFAEFTNNLWQTLDLQKLATTVGLRINGIKDALLSFLTETDWAGMATKVGDSINTLFNTVDWYGLGETVTTGFNTIVTTLSTFIKTVDWGKIGESIGDSLEGLITNIDWAGLGQLLSNAVIGLLDLIGDFFETVDWGALGDSLGRGIVDLITNIDWLTVAGQLLRGIVGMLGGVVELLLGLLGGIFSGIGEALKGIGCDCIGGFFVGIGDALSSIGTWLKEHIFDPIVNGIKSLFGIHSPSTVFAELGGFLIEGLLQGITAAWSTITGFFSGAVSALSSLLSTAWSGIKSAASTAWSGIKSTVTSAFTSAKNTVATVAGTLKSNLSTTWNTIKSGATTAWNNVKTSVTTAFNNTKSTVVSAANSMKSSLSSSWNTIKSNATQAWNNIKSTASSAWSNMKSTASSSLSNIKSTCSSAWGNIQSTASSKWSSITSTVSSKWSNLKSIMSSVSWSSVGSNLVSGLKSGITSAWSSLTTSVGNLCKGLLEKVKGAFGIASPSKKMAEIGGFLDAGLENGITGNQKSVLSTVSNLANAVSDEMAGADVPELAVAGSSMVSGLDAVAAKLAGVAQIFQSITDMLAKVGFTTPQIAAGTVVPYKTRVDTSTLPDASTEALNAFVEGLDGLDERMADEAYLLRQILEAIRRLNLNIDIDALTRAITKQQKDRQLNFGGV